MSEVGSNPSGARRRFSKLRPSNPAATSSASAIAICTVTSVRCARRQPTLVVARVPRSSSPTLLVPLRASDVSPIAPPVNSAVTITSATAPPPNTTSCNRGMSFDPKPSLVVSTAAAMGTAIVADSAPSNWPSITKRRMSAARVAPSAIATATSRAVCSARSRNSPTTFVVASSRTTTTMQPRRTRWPRTGSTIVALSDDTVTRAPLCATISRVIAG